MAEINLLDTLPKPNRPLVERANASEEDRKCHWALGKEYFDGTRAQGLGGYWYDARWKPVVHRMRDYYSLDTSSWVLDVGCAKGFLLKDIKKSLRNLFLLLPKRYSVSSSEQSNCVISLSHK